MADSKVQLQNSLNSKIYPRTTLDNIVKSVASSTTLITSGGVIKKDFLDLTGLISSNYVSSANIIPTSAINGLSTAINNAASTYVVSSAVAKSNVTSNYNDIKSANEVTTKIPNAYAVREFLSDYDETIKEYIDSTCQPSSTLSAGFGINITGGSTISLARTRPITTIPSTSTSVTLQPGEAYIIDATTTSKTLNVGSVPSGHFGLESHMEIFVANTGYIVTGTNVVLTQPLEPDSVNNCTIRFHDGFAIISVEDHVAGYIVFSSGSASNTSGTLAYGLTSASSNYIAFDGRLNGSVIPFGGVTANGKKHVVGNGYDNTILTGSVNCGASKFTVANLSLQNITVNSGTLTLGDAYIPSGSTVVVSGGVLEVEKVMGAGSESVIDFNGNRIANSNPDALYANLAITGLVPPSGIGVGGFSLYGNNAVDNVSITVLNCVFTGNSTTYGLVWVRGGLNSYTGKRIINLTGCTFTNNIGTSAAVLANSNGIANITDCTFDSVNKISTAAGGLVTFAGSNSIPTIIDGQGSVTLTSGATLDLTGNTNTTPINPGGGITFASGGATVYPSAGSASAYMLDNVTLPTGAKLTNTNAIDLGGKALTVFNGKIDGITCSGVIQASSGTSISNTIVASGGSMYINTNARADSITIMPYARCALFRSGALLSGAVVSSRAYLPVFSGATATEPVVMSGGSLYVLSGGSALLVTSNTGAVVTVSAGGYITYK